MALLRDRSVGRGGDQHHVTLQRVAQRPPLAVAEPPTAEAHVDHDRPASGGVDEGRDHARAGQVGLLQDQAAVRTGARDPGSIVGRGAREAPDMGAVADLVTGADRRTVEVPDDRDLGGELGMGRVDPRVDHADQRARPPAEIPGGGKALAVQVPLVGLPRRPDPVGTSQGHSARVVAGGGTPAPRHHMRGSSSSSRAASSAIVSPAAGARWDAYLGHRRARPPSPWRAITAPRLDAAPRSSLRARAGRATPAPARS